MLADDERIGLDLTTLRLMGVHVALEGFGTGYSGLAQLTRLPHRHPQARPVARDRIDRDAQGRALGESMIEIGRALGLDVVAEGVETPAQLGRCAASGYAFAQGFLISRPDARAADLAAQLSRRCRSPVAGPGRPAVNAAPPAAPCAPASPPPGRRSRCWSAGRPALVPGSTCAVSGPAERAPHRRAAVRRLHRHGDLARPRRVPAAGGLGASCGGSCRSPGSCSASARRWPRCAASAATSAARGVGGAAAAARRDRGRRRRVPARAAPRPAAGRLLACVVDALVVLVAVAVLGEFVLADAAVTGRASRPR